MGCGGSKADQTVEAAGRKSESPWGDLAEYMEDSGTGKQTAKEAAAAKTAKAASDAAKAHSAAAQDKAKVDAVAAAVAASTAKAVAAKADAAAKAGASSNSLADDAPDDKAAESARPPQPPPPSGPLTSEDIQARIVGSVAPEFYSLSASTGITMRYATLSQRGYYPEDLNKANQDAYKVVESFDGISGDILLGVFDGHGKDGDACSRWVRDGIAEELSHQLKKSGKSSSSKHIGEALTKTFLRLNRELLHQERFDAEYSGTTAVTALFRAGQIHIANVGDSRVIIGERRGQHTIAVPLSHDQTPFRRDERQRCKLAGSVVRTSGHIEGETKYTVAWEEALGIDDDEVSSRLASGLRPSACIRTSALLSFTLTYCSFSLTLDRTAEIRLAYGLSTSAAPVVPSLAQ